MSKFRINEKVLSIEDNKTGIVRLRNVVHEGKKTTVEYMVDFGGTMSNWKIMTKKQLQRLHNDERDPYTVKEYLMFDSQRLIMVAKIDNFKYLADNPKSTTWYDDVIEKKGRKLTIGFSIYNGKDDYDIAVGIKYAKHRLKDCPFTTMESKFNGEFNKETVEAIMNAKAGYIKAHWNEFYRPRN